jgi:hypothetical protein
MLWGMLTQGLPPIGWMNAGLMADLPSLAGSGAEGVGLFRTELQFLIRNKMPRRSELSALYARVMDSARGKRVAFRTLDIGSDKVLSYMKPNDEPNPAMGWRAIRLGLDMPGVLRMQVQALIRAANGRPLAVMFPLIAEPGEYRRARAEVDKALERRGHAFVRYADDCNVYVRSRRAGERVMGLLRRLYVGLRLHVNEAKSAVDRPQKRKLLGYSFYWGRRGEGVKRRVAPKALTAMKDRVRELTRPTRSQRIARVAADLRSYLTGWKNYFRLADTPKVFRELDEWIRHRLRALHLRHWKRGRVTYRELRARGVSEQTAAYVAANTRRWWKNSAMAIHIAFPIHYFDELGVPRLAA